MLTNFGRNLISIANFRRPIVYFSRILSNFAFWVEHDNQRASLKFRNFVLVFKHVKTRALQKSWIRRTVRYMRIDDCIKNVSKGLDLSWIIQFIFHSKYFADSDWLQSPALFFITNCRWPYLEATNNRPSIRWYICLKTWLFGKW